MSVRSTDYAICCRILDLVVEAESDALQPLQAAATVIQKHWRGVKVHNATLLRLFGFWTHAGVSKEHCCSVNLMMFPIPHLHTDTIKVHPCNAQFAMCSCIRKLVSARSCMIKLQSIHALKCMSPMMVFRVLLVAQARRTRRLMQNVVRGSIIQSRAAHYHITAAQQDVTATMLRQIAASAELHQQALGQDYMQPCINKPASVTEQLPMQCFADLALQQPATATATCMQLKTGLMTQTSQGPHIAWADQAVQDTADQMASSALARQMPKAGSGAAAVAADLGDLKGLERPIRSGRHNVLFEAARPHQSSQGHGYLNAIGHYRQQMESSLEALRQEMEAFQSEMLGQFVNIGASAEAS